MAQMISRFFIALILSITVTSIVIANDVPSSAIEAEAQQDWSAAAILYRKELAKQPDNVALWRKLSEVEAAQHHSETAAEALCKVVELQPADANLYSECSKAWSVANQPLKAFDAIERARTLSPDNVDILLAHALLANWLGNYSLAEQDFTSVIKLAPDTQKDLIDDLARTYAWQGKLDEATRLLKDYVSDRVEDKEAHLDLIKFEMWRGNYPGALEALDEYSEKIGEDNEERIWRARVLAWAGWWKSALQINESLLKEFPENYDINYSQVIGLRQSFLPLNAISYQEKLEALKPESKETLDLLRATHLALASKLYFTANHFSDSLGIRIDRLNLDGLWVWNVYTCFTANAGAQRFIVPRYSLLDSIIDRTDVEEKRFQLGLQQAVTDDFALEGQLGISKLLAPNDTTSLYSLALKGMPADSFHWSLGTERDRVDISPRSVSLGLTRRGIYGVATWSPSVRYYLDATVRHDEYSDNNQRDEWVVALRRQTLRTSRVNLDLGVVVQALSYDFYTNNGYYAPENYHRYALTGSSYFKFSDNAGLNVLLALGTQKDEKTNGWKSAHDISFDYTLGIFSDWQLRLNAGYTQRRQGVGAFDGKIIGLGLERRF